MKTQSKNEGMLKRTYFLPENACIHLEKAAKENRRSINDELIVILDEYFTGGFVKLDNTIKKAIAVYAKKKDFTIAEAANYLISTRISVFEEVEDAIIAEANKEHDMELENYKKESAV